MLTSLQCRVFASSDFISLLGFSSKYLTLSRINTGSSQESKPGFLQDRLI
ncbi:hypothetical protein HanPI659440_Chr05g0202051 [Helianthus annuus]|nr:hypothetical protein HanPI659440_Chr05g0202051 [Helianthus annuus]